MDVDLRGGSSAEEVIELDWQGIDGCHGLNYEKQSLCTYHDHHRGHLKNVFIGEFGP